MKLIIFPGGGTANTTASDQRNNRFSEHAISFGYTSVDTSVSWTQRPDELLKVDRALAIAGAALERQELPGEAYDIFGRSFGGIIALMATMRPKLPGLHRISLWGAPPFWLVWKMFSRDLTENRERYAAMGMNFDETFFREMEPIEVLLQETTRSVVVAAGSKDPYSPPAFHHYLEELTPSRPNVRFPQVVEDAHEMSKIFASTDRVIADFLWAILGGVVPPPNRGQTVHSRSSGGI